MRIQFFLLCAFLGGNLIAQDNSFAPFPSKIRTYKNGAEVILTWEDSDDLTQEKYAIYRSLEEIDEDFIKREEPVALIDRGVMIYTDLPDRSGEIYYAITCIENGIEYAICLPFRNSTTISVSIEEAILEEELAGEIRDLQAKLVDGKVALEFQATQTNRQYSVYRSNSPIDSSYDLRSASLIRILEPGRFYYLDSPLAGIRYYYAVVDHKLHLSQSEDVVYPGNYLTEPIGLPIHDFLDNEYWDAPQRRAPLPEIRLERFYEEIPEANFFLPTYREIPREWEIELNALFGDIETVEYKQYPLILATELSRSQQPIELELQTILNDQFNRELWQEASESLIQLLAKVDDSHLRSRIFFYLGQCHYFNGEENYAFLDFTLSARDYPLESSLWIESMLYQP